jgi:hypothetical protein
MRRRSVVGLTLGTLAVTGLVGSAQPPMPPGFLSAYHWQSDDPQFGGFSALDVSSMGLNLVTVSDRGFYTSGRLARDAVGLISQVVVAPIRKLHDDDDTDLGRDASDSEGLAIAADGTAFVSFERWIRVARFAVISGPNVWLPAPPEFQTLLPNASLESLTIDGEGTLYTLPERPINGAQSFPVYRFKNSVWDQPFTVPKRGFFLAVDADIGPDGKFYLLEREFHGFAGFASRVRRFTISTDALTDEETLLQSLPGQHDNLEGISVWRDQQGSLRLTMISDDNLLFLQRTEIVEYRVPD